MLDRPFSTNKTGRDLRYIRRVRSRRLD
jgi:hypothetical protein